MSHDFTDGITPLGQNTASEERQFTCTCNYKHAFVPAILAGVSLRVHKNGN